jgi:hypothetical protein
MSLAGRISIAHMTGYRAISVLIVAAIGFGTGCSGGSSTRTIPPPAQSPTPSTPTAMTPRDLVVTTAQLGAGWDSRLIAGGDQVHGQVTLDLCGGGYRSEALRTARLQMAYRDGKVEISNEVVKYGGNGASLAYQELLQRIAHCPGTVTMPEAGGVKAHWTLTRLATRPGLVSKTIAVGITVTAQGHETRGISVFQFDGPWLAAVYSFETSAPAAAAVYTAAAVEAQNLAKANSSGT